MNGHLHTAERPDVLAGQYRAHTPGGLHTLSYELAHVVQQGGATGAGIHRLELGDSVDAGPLLDPLVSRQLDIVDEYASIFLGPTAPARHTPRSREQDAL